VLAQRKSRKRRKERQRAARPAEPEAESGQGAMERGYARGRKKDDEARAKLKPLGQDERPLAVTIGAVVAVGLAVAELVALLISYDSDEPNKIVRSAVVVPLLLFVAWGMWKKKYWAVLGMQTLLALTIVFAAVGAMTALNLSAFILVLAIIVPASLLFWFLVKAMARIQLPTPPGRNSPGR